MVELVGGRFIHLVLAAQSMVRVRTFETVKEELFSLVKQELTMLKILLPPSITTNALSKPDNLAEDRHRIREPVVFHCQGGHVANTFQQNLAVCPRNLGAPRNTAGKYYRVTPSGK